MACATSATCLSLSANLICDRHNAPVLGQGLASSTRCRGGWSRSQPPSHGRTASLIRPDLICDRHSIRDRPTAPRSPWQNGYAERLIGSIRRECVDHIVVRLTSLLLRDPNMAEKVEMYGPNFESSACIALGTAVGSAFSARAATNHGKVRFSNPATKKEIFVYIILPASMPLSLRASASPLAAFRTDRNICGRRTCADSPAPRS